MKKIKELFGIFFIILGLIGIFVPVLPTVPFFLLALYLIATSNEKFYSYLIGTNFYKDNIKVLREERKMKKTNKIKTLISVFILLAIGFYFMKDLKVKWILPIVFIFHIYLFSYKIKDLD